VTLCSLGIKDTFYRNMLLCSGQKLLIQGEDKKNVVHVSVENVRYKESGILPLGLTGGT